MPQVSHLQYALEPNSKKKKRPQAGQVARRVITLEEESTMGAGHGVFPDKVGGVSGDLQQPSTCLQQEVKDLYLSQS